MDLENNEILTKAKKILNKNWCGTYTVPSKKLYPNQWNWDSGFIAIGYSHYNQKKAQSELLSLFEGQWKNGMLPHIIFRANDHYFPGPDYWEAWLSENAPEINTSGLTQPPIHAVAALQIYKNAKNKEKAKKFLEKIFPKILNFHRYLLTKRDPEKSGLVTIFHPWESGLDNSPRWDEALSKITSKKIPFYVREDTKIVSEKERPSQEEYNKYIYLTELMKKYKYNEEKIYKASPFKIKDVVFSSILHVSNNALLEISKIIGENHPEITYWIKTTKKNFFSYFCDGIKNEALLYDFDLVQNKRIVKRTVASLVPIYTDLLKKAQINRIIYWLNHAHYCGQNCRYPLTTSNSLNEKDFNALNYWRGPIWVNCNWMLYKGLLQQGFFEKAEVIKNAIVNLVKENGFYEYYNPLTGKGLGGNNFSWTASLLIDLLSTNNSKKA